MLSSVSDLEALFDAALDAIVGMNSLGRITHWNRASETVFGWQRQEVVGHEMASIIIPLPLRDNHRKGLQRYLSTGKGSVLNQRLELIALHRNGNEFPVELTIVALHHALQPHFFGFVRDISGRKQIEQIETQRLLQLELLYECSLLAQRDIGFEAALKDCLAIICRLTGWKVGHVFLPSGDNPQLLNSSDTWYFEHDRYRPLVALTAELAFERGKGLPGRIWVSAQPEWISDLQKDPNFPRARICAQLGLKSGFGFPIGRDKLYAILEFFSDQARDVEPHLSLTVKTIGELISRVVEREEAEYRQGLLIKELRHRVGNVLQIAGALFAQSAKAHSSLEEIQTSFFRQLQALGATQRLIFETSDRPVNLSELIGQVIEPYGQNRFHLEGESVFVQAQSVMTIALALNELATNAVKHGSLSSPTGSVDMNWKQHGNHLEIEWMEHGGPLVRPLQEAGFGRELLRRTIVHQLGGNFDMQFPPGGIVARIVFPL